MPFERDFHLNISIVNIKLYIRIDIIRKLIEYTFFRVHNKVRNFPCIHCGKALVNQTRLKYHINRFHNGLMPPPSKGDHNGEDQMKDESSSGLHHEEYYNHYSN
jgi:hypothetical protein